MTTPRERIEKEVSLALKSGDKPRLSTLRLLLSAIDNERIRSGEAVDEETFLGLVQKGIKQRRESSEQYRQGKRLELAEKEEREIEVLEEFLPPPVADEELRQAIRDFVAEQGLSGMPALGVVMKEMLHRFAGRTDGATINRIARDILTQDA